MKFQTAIVYYCIRPLVLAKASVEAQDLPTSLDVLLDDVPATLMDIISNVGSATEPDQTTPVYQCSSPLSSEHPSPISSVFSCDATSSQRLITPASSSSSGEWENARILYSLSNPQNTTAADAVGLSRAHVSLGLGTKASRDFEPIAWRGGSTSSDQVRPHQGIPLSSRQNPRRSRPQLRADTSDGTSGVPQPRPPPALVRQEVRKDSFVDSLVGEPFSRRYRRLSC